MTENPPMKIAVASGKGGTGKTLVSTNLFWAIQNAGISATLVDCDAEEPNVAEFISGELLNSFSVTQKIPVIDPELCKFCGKCFNYCNYNAIVYLPANHFIQVVEDLCHDCGACIVACKFDAITEKEKDLGVVQTMFINSNAEIIEARANVGVYSPVPVIKKAINSLNDRSLAIFDSPPGISCPFIATVGDADFVVLVTEPTPFGLNDLKLSVETLQQLKKPCGVIVNRAGLGNRDVYNWLNDKNIPLLLEIPFDREIARIYSEGHLLVEEKPAYQFQFIELLKTIERIVKI
ncbi:MAG: ATP-binding protein [Prolixibacteraceae bacterium]|nr:ATP-binding protein [Prolixibacteraceae bacterium]